jgi:hypothetical protein
MADPGAASDPSMIQHPASDLIRRIVIGERTPEPGDVEQIITTMAAAPFSMALSHVPARLRVAYRGTTLSWREPSLMLHLVTRVLVDRQWREGTTVAEYLQDTRSAVLWPGARLAVFERWGEDFSATISPSAEVVPGRRIGREPLPWLLVVYSATDATIRTACMLSSLDTIDMGHPLWLR